MDEGEHFQRIPQFVMRRTDRFICTKATQYSKWKIGDIVGVYEMTPGYFYIYDPHGNLHQNPTSARFKFYQEKPMPTTKWRSTTSGGYKIVIHTEKGEGSHPIVGQRKVAGNDNRWVAMCWTAQGRYMSTDISSLDLVPLPDVEGFYGAVMSVSHNKQQTYDAARQWFIDHPEELK